MQVVSATLSCHSSQLKDLWSGINKDIKSLRRPSAAPSSELSIFHCLNRLTRLRHNYSTQLRPVTTITLTIEIWEMNEVSQIEQPHRDLKFENMHTYLFMDTICSSKLTASLEVRPRKAVCFLDLNALAFKLWCILSC